MTRLPVTVLWELRVVIGTLERSAANCISYKILTSTGKMENKSSLSQDFLWQLRVVIGEGDLIKSVEVK